MKDLYSFDSRYLSSSFQVESTGRWEDDKKLIIGKYQGIKFPVIFNQVVGKKLLDILSTGILTLLLISNQLNELLKENHFTGWTTFPIILKDKKGNQIEGYQGFSVTGISGRKIFTNSPIIETRYVPNGPIVKIYKGATVDLKKWDGSDFFVPEDTTEIIITKKVAKILERNKISNLSLGNLAEAEMDVEIWDKMERWTNKNKNRF